ncbi:hypothetical protein LZK73_11940 [Neorhizobium galegae]|nr:hypothetical protein LZK73_11940 [Neorhizobium galegae]
MIFIIMIVAGVVGGFMAQAKGKNIPFWSILSACFPFALIFLAFMKKHLPPDPKAKNPLRHNSRFGKLWRELNP